MQLANFDLQSAGEALGGAFGATAALGWWIKTLIADNKGLKERNDLIADKAIAALSVANLHIAAASKELEEIKGTVTHEHARTRERIAATIEEIRNEHS